MSDVYYDPDAGGVGLLTWPQFERFTRAIDDARTHLGWWRVAGHIRSGDPDEHRTRSNEPVIPLPSTWLAAEEISNLLGEINQWETLEDVAKFGHEFALQLTREVETAMHKWPMGDRPHKVRFLRCRKCQQMTLRLYPPRLSIQENESSRPVRVHTKAPEGKVAVVDVIDITVKCTNHECRAIEDPKNFAHDVALIEMENQLANRRVGDGKGCSRTSGPASDENLRMDSGGESENLTSGSGAVAVSA